MNLNFFKRNQYLKKSKSVKNFKAFKSFKGFKSFFNLKIGLGILALCLPINSLADSDDAFAKFAQKTGDVSSPYLQKNKDLSEEVKHYLNNHNEALLESVKKTHTLFKKDEDWFFLKNTGTYPNKNKKLEGNLLAFFDYDCKSCLKLYNALNLFEENKSKKPFLFPIQTSFIPILLPKEHPYSTNLFQKAILNVSLKEILSQKDFESAHKKLFEDITNGNLRQDDEKELKKWFKKENINYEAFEKEIEKPLTYSKIYFYKKLLDGQEVKDSPMVVVNGKYFIPSTTINKLNQYDLMQLFELLSSIAILDKTQSIEIEK